MPIFKNGTHHVSETGSPHLRVDIQHWSYLAEGGFHIILRYDGPEPDLRGRILRIGKKSLVHALARLESLEFFKSSSARGQVFKTNSIAGVSTHELAAEGIGSLGQTIDGDLSSLPLSNNVGTESLLSPGLPVPRLQEAGLRSKFERAVLEPLLGAHYVQPGRSVTLSREDIQNIHKSIDNLRPTGRLRDESGVWSTAAQLEPDKTGFWLDVPEDFLSSAGPSEDAGVIIAVEVKPKGSGMPVGALVPEGPNRLKYRVHRFDAQQRFKAQTKQSWGMIRRSTGYHPTDLFSGDSARASKALKELLITPQNKFRAWENGRMLFGAGSGKSKPEGLAIGTKLLDEAVVRADLDDQMGAPGQTLMDLVGAILTGEPLLHRMAEAQALDVLGVEGGGLVFDRLVAISDSARYALDLLEKTEREPFKKMAVPEGLTLPKELLERLRAGPASTEMIEREFGEELKVHHENALQVVENLKEEDCVQLIRRYIIGLGVMDCSVMLSLKAIGGGAEKLDEPSSAVAAKVVRTQTDGTSGVLVTPDGRQVAYCLSVVDAGPKPATKLAKKADKENKIWDYVAKLGDDVFL